MSLNKVPKSQDVRTLTDSRESVRAVRFFVKAIGSQLADVEAKLGRVELAASAGEYEDRLARIEAERDAALQRAMVLSAQLDEAQREMTELQQELVRQHVTFADHHAAKQEIAHLRAELEALRGPRLAVPVVPDTSRQQRRWWQIGRG
jgi:hypothetical protein